MNQLSFTWKNVTRNPRRTGLTLLSMTASIALLTLLLAVEDTMRFFSQKAEQSLRISVRHKTGFALLLPIAYRDKIAQVPGVVAVNGFSWYGGVFRDPKQILPSISCEPETLQAVWGDRLEATPAEWEAFKKDRMGALVAPLVAARHGWKTGDVVPLKGNVLPFDLTFRISGVMTDSFDPMIFLFHRDYLEEAKGNPGEVGNYWVKIDRRENVTPAINQINAMFENSTHPVVAETEKGLFELVTGMMQVLRLVVVAIGTAVVISIMLVGANTIAMSVRERMSEVGVLRAMGFRRHHIFTFLLGESCLISMIGGTIGSVLAFWTCHWSASFIPDPVIAAFLSKARPELILYSMSIAGVVGLAAGVVPAVGAVRVPVSHALRQVV